MHHEELPVQVERRSTGYDKHKRKMTLLFTSFHHPKLLGRYGNGHDRLVIT